MFWDIYCDLCSRAGESPNGVAAKLGFSNATCTKWKKGSVPGGASLTRIADYFEVGVDYLMYRTDDPSPTKKEPVQALSEEDDLILQILRTMTVEEKLDLIEYLKRK